MSNVVDTLIIQVPQGAERRWPITSAEFVIGRSYRCHVVIGEENTLISGEHLGVAGTDRNYTLYVLGQNGVVFGGEALAAGEQRAWRGEEVQIADYRLRIELVNPPAPPPNPAKPTSSANPEDDRIYVQGIVPEQVTITPPGNAELSVSVIYRGAVIDHFELAPKGERINPQWFIPSDEIREGRGGQGRLSLMIRVADEATNLADAYPFRVLVQSQNTRRTIKELDVHLTIAPYYRFISQIVGGQDEQTVMVGDTIYVAITNQGNSEQTYTIACKTGKDKAVTFERLQIPCTLAPGQQKQIALRPIWPQPAWWNRRWVDRAEKQHGATITVQPAQGEPQAHELTIISRGLIPTWVVRYGPIGLVALGLLLLYLLQPSVEAWAGTCENPNNTFTTNTTTITVCVAVNQVDRLIFTWENGQKQEILEPKSSDTYTLEGAFAVPPQLKIDVVNWFGAASLPLPFTAKSTAVAIWVTATPIPPTPPVAPIIKNFQVNPSRLIQGENSTIRFEWEVSANAKRAIITDQEGNKTVDMEIPPHFKGDIPAPTKPSTYTLVVEGEAAIRSQPSLSLVVNVVTPECRVNEEAGGLTLRPEPRIRDYHDRAIMLPSGTVLVVKAKPVLEEGDQWLYVDVAKFSRDGWVAYRDGEQVLVTCENVSFDDLDKLPPTAIPNVPTPIPPTETHTPVPPTATPTPPPSPTATPVPTVFFNFASTPECRATAGKASIEGTTYIHGTPAPGFEVVYGDFTSKKIEERLEGRKNETGFYRLTLDRGPIGGSVWVRNDKQEPISTPVSLVGLNCYQAVVNFDVR